MAWHGTACNGMAQHAQLQYHGAAWRACVHPCMWAAHCVHPPPPWRQAPQPLACCLPLSTPTQVLKLALEEGMRPVRGNHDDSGAPLVCAPCVRPSCMYMSMAGCRWKGLALQQHPLRMRPAWDGPALQSWRALMLLASAIPIAERLRLGAMYCGLGPSRYKSATHPPPACPWPCHLQPMRPSEHGWTARTSPNPRSRCRALLILHCMCLLRLLTGRTGVLHAYVSW